MVGPQRLLADRQRPAIERLGLRCVGGATNDVADDDVIAVDLAVAGGDSYGVAAADGGDGDPGVVVADATRDAAEEGEGADVALEECLGALAGEGADEDRVGVRQGQDEDGHLGRPAVEDDLGLAEVDLGLAGRVGQRDEDLGVTASPGPHGVLDDRQAAFVAVLVAEPLEDALGGVPLLPGGLAVILEDLMEDRQQGVELGPRAGRGPAIARRLGMAEDLGERVPVDVVLTASRSLAQAVDEDATADLGPVLHVGKHPCTSRGRVREGVEPPSSLARSPRGEPWAPRFSTARRSPPRATFFGRRSHLLLQFCLAHLIRDVKYLTTLPDARDRAYGGRLREALRSLFAVIHRREELPAVVFQNELEAARAEVLRCGAQDV